MPVELNPEKFDELKDGEETWVIDFWAEWCGPCKQMAPIFEEVSEEVEDINFGKVDIEEHQELATQNGIRSIPTFLLMKDGEVVDQKMGAMQKEDFQQWVEGHA